MTPELFRKRLLETGIAAHSDIIGSSDAEIRQLERKYGLILPAAYRQFLSVAGHGAGRLMTDVHVFHKDAISATERFKKDYPELPEKTFVFAHRLGDFWFFVADGTSEDPPIMVGRKRILRKWVSLSGI